MVKVFQFYSLGEMVPQNIYNKVIYLNSPSNFNDPTENNFSIKGVEHDDEGDEYKRKVFSSIKNEFLKNKERKITSVAKELGVSRSKVVNEIDKNINNWEEFESSLKAKDSVKVERFCHDAVKDAQLNFRIASLTSKDDNPLMWGHYADGMRGVCIEYDIEESDLDKVVYSSCYKVDMKKIISGDVVEEVKNTFLRKSKDWSYENEYRIIRSDDSFYAISPGQVKSVRFGYRCDDQKAEFLKEMVLSSFGYDVVFYVARNSVSDYSIRNTQVEPDNLIKMLEEEKAAVHDHNTMLLDRYLSSF